MYRTFDLVNKSLYIIGFWSLVFYILEVRKFGRGFTSVALETILGWCIFATITTLFVFYLASVYRTTRKENLIKRTKNVVEDGMVFTVGGHTKVFEVLPKALLVESDSLAAFEAEYSINSEESEELINARSQKLKSFLEKDIPLKLVLEKDILNSKENEQDIDDEDNSPIKTIKDQYNNSHESRKIDKGLFAYKHQFNLLFSHILNHELNDLNKAIKNGSCKDSRKVIKAKRQELNEKSALLKVEIEESITQVLKAVKNFKYTGIETTTPQIKTRRELDFSNYQLVIFTALFPYIDWFSLRSAFALNALDPEMAATLTSTELSKTKDGEFGLSLRDKRILWNSKRMYEIYLKRDKDLKFLSKSDNNMPIAFNSKGDMYNPLEECVGLCELLRFSQTVQLVQPPKVKNVENKAPYNENDIIRLVCSLLAEKGRFNTSGNSRVGVIKDNLIYLNMADFLPKFNGRFKEKYPNIANNVEYKRALSLLYYKLKKMGLLGMRIIEEQSELAETYIYKTDGELFTVSIDIKGLDEKIYESCLIIHAAKMFKDIASHYQDYQATPKILNVSEKLAIPASPYFDKIQNIIEAHEAKDKKTKAIIEVQKTEVPIVADLNNVQSSLNSEIKQATKENPLDSNPNPKANQSNETPSNEGKAKAQPQKTNKVVVKNEPIEVFNALDDLDMDTINSITENLFEATETDLLIANKQLNTATKKDSVVSAYDYIHRDIQVVSLKKSGRYEGEEQSKIFAVNEVEKKNLQRIECSRQDINNAGEDLNFKMFKLIDAQMKNQLNDDVKMHTSKSKHLIIPYKNIHKLFNVIEQMALFQKKGESNFWSIKEEESKGNDNKEFSQIRVIRCIKIHKSQEENFYKTLRKEMWTKRKTEKLFKEIQHRLDDISDADKAKYNIKKSKSDGGQTIWVIPKQHIGKLKRTSIDINNFLAYTTQRKDELSKDLHEYADALDSVVLSNTTYIRFWVSEK